MPAMDEEEVHGEVMNLLEAGENNSLESLACGPDIPSLLEQIGVLVSTGKFKEVKLTHEHRLTVTFTFHEPSLRKTCIKKDSAV